MSLPNEVFEQIAQENDQRMWRMLGYMQAHTAMGHFLFMNKWQITSHNGIALLSQGILLSTTEYHYMHIYPEGVYKCSMCETNRNMDHKTNCYYSNDTGAIICPHCLHEATDARPVKSYVEGIQAQFVQPSANIELFDMRHTPEELQNHRETHREQLQTLNSDMNNPYMYIDDKRTETLYEERLARRVVSRWRKFMENKRRGQLLKVLYLGVGMDMNASIMLARQTPVM